LEEEIGGGGGWRRRKTIGNKHNKTLEDEKTRDFFFLLEKESAFRFYTHRSEKFIQPPSPPPNMGKRCTLLNVGGTEHRFHRFCTDITKT
jgi:hypothetical protein